MENDYYQRLIPLLEEEPLIVQQDPHGERLQLDFGDQKSRLVIMRSDESHTPTNFKNCLVFRNYINPTNPAINERPIPLPYTDNYSAFTNSIKRRKYLASFSGHCGSSKRKMVAHILEEIKKRTGERIFIKQTSAFGKGLSKQEYSNLMSETVLAVCPWGASYETFRLTEALMAGCIPIQVKRPTQWYDPGEECLWINSWHELPKVMAWVKQQDSEKIEDMSRNSIKFYEEKLSPEAVAKYINSEWKKFIGDKK